MCKRSASIPENVQKICRVLQKICSYYRKYTENLQVLLKMCTKSATPCTFSGILADFATPCRFSSHACTNIQWLVTWLVRTNSNLSDLLFGILTDFMHIFCRALLILCTFSGILADFVHIFSNTCSFSAHFL